MRPALSLFLATVTLTACSLPGFGKKQFQPNPDPNHTHADIAVWLEGMQWDFSDPKYMSGTVEDEHDEHAHEHKHEHLHLHDSLGHVLHSHKPGLTVGAFLTSLKFEMSDRCMRLDTGIHVCPESGKTWKMFVRNVADPEPQWNTANFNPEYVFRDMDQILLTYQSDDGIAQLNIQKQQEKMTDDACRYSRTCPWRGDPPEENCIADPEVPCVAPLQ